MNVLDKFLDGYNAMLDALQPEKIIFYGNVPKECMGDIVHVKPFQDKWKEATLDGW